MTQDTGIELESVHGAVQWLPIVPQGQWWNVTKYIEVLYLNTILR